MIITIADKEARSLEIGSLPVRYKDDMTKLVIHQLAMEMGRVGSRAMGLAAPQIGYGLRVFYVLYNDPVTGDRVKMTVLNPEILEYSKDTCVLSEGCLSIPGKRYNVRRSKRITATWLDHEGTAHTEEINSTLSQVFQHEYDHLNGIMINSEERRV